MAAQLHEWTYEREMGAEAEAPEVLAARREAVRQAARNAGMIGLPTPAPAPPPTDDFPSLLGGPKKQATGWANLANNARPRSEDFPALHPARSTGGLGRGGAGGGGGSNFRTAVEAYPTRAQEIAMSGAGDGGWCFDYPMPPEQGGGGGGGGGGKKGKGGGQNRVPSIGNMKLKVDKKAAKRKQKAAAAGGGVGGRGSGLEARSMSPPPTTSISAAAREEAAAAAAIAAVAAAEAAELEQFPLAPGMKAPPPTASSQTQTLAQSLARQNLGASRGGGGGGGGGSPSVVLELRELLGEEGFSDVREISASYRGGLLMPGEYLKAMEELLPKDRFGWVGLVWMVGWLC